LIGVHPNTIRFYEKMALLPAIPRTQSGYRIFSDRHATQLRLLRAAFRAEIISSRLRSEALEIVKTAARNDIAGAYQKTKSYYKHLQDEKAKAEQAIEIVHDIINSSHVEEWKVISTHRRETALLLGITTNVLRDWERNGLITIPRDDKGIRKYGAKEIDRLIVIRTLRNAHYSMMSILRMLNRLDHGELNVRESIDTPGDDEDIVRAADRYITALNSAGLDACEMLKVLDEMK